MNLNRLQNKFSDLIQNIVRANNEIVDSIPDIENQLPALYYRTFNSLVYDVMMYSRSVKEITELDPEIRTLNPDIKWKDIIGIGDRLTHQYRDVSLYLILKNINETFAPFMKNLNTLVLPKYLTLPKEVSLTLPLILDPEIISNLLKYDHTQNDYKEIIPKHTPGPKMK